MFGAKLSPKPTADEGAAVTERLMVFSFDGHVGGPPDSYLGYIEPQYRADLRGAQRREQRVDRVLQVPRVRAARTFGVFDAGRLLEELDAEGIAGQVLLNGHGMATTPFFSVANDPYPPALRAAGAKAFHRWLADFAADGQGRLVPIADSGRVSTWRQPSRSCGGCGRRGSPVCTCRSGVRRGIAAAPRPYFDRFWAACEEMGLVLVLHAAFGAEQGRVLDMLRRKSRMKEELVERNPEFASLDLSSLTAGELLELGGGVPEASMQRFGPSALHAARRALSQLILGGVFERFPKLKVVLVELRADWIPATLAHLDARVAESSLGLPLKPSEYFGRNGWVAPSSPRPAEVTMRHEIGIDKFIFATDYPHPEGTWPDTSEWLRAGLPRCPGGRAATSSARTVTCLGIDPSPLYDVARRIGPRSADILGSQAEVDPDLIENFNKRSGFTKSREDVDRASDRRGRRAIRSATFPVHPDTCEDKENTTWSKRTETESRLGVLQLDASRLLRWRSAGCPCRPSPRAPQLLRPAQPPRASSRPPRMPSSARSW